MSNTMDMPVIGVLSTAAGERRLSLIDGMTTASPGVVAASTRSVPGSISAWFFAALLAWTSASSFAELGAALPHNGGPQAFLGYTYGPLMSFLYSWTSISLLSQYMIRVLWNTTRSDDLPSLLVPEWVIQATAIAAIGFTTFLAVNTPGLGPRATVIFMNMKVSTLLAIIIFGLFHAILRPSLSNPTPNVDPKPSPTAYVRAIMACLFAYQSFHKISYVGGEMRNPARDIPRTLHISMTLATILLVLTNWAYFEVLDLETIASHNAVALDFGWALFGAVGGTCFALVVALSCLGTLTSSLFTSARLIYSAARLGQLPAYFGVLDSKRETPVRAVLLEATLITAFILLGGGFRSIVNFSVVGGSIFSALNASAVLVLRFREPELTRPYKAWVIMPVTFLLLSVAIIVIPTIDSPRGTLIIIAFITLGIPVYYATRPQLSIANGEQEQEEHRSTQGVV
ncbi:amino acid/polyamine transporter I [Multifurca ochricompacta]|uniref:Amino acid/polyamine transporter I n=1 Tax=Multifurca ochricompacta TaxID=376703 RepID=A0AAD4LWZ5_9AGAM|nr:amino acid/polyamine transporter I [Multifurca ochricompacta]